MIYACTYHYDKKPLLGMEYKQIWRLDDDNRFRFYAASETIDESDKKTRSYDLILDKEVADEMRMLLTHIDQVDQKDYVEKWTLILDEKEMTGPMSGGVFSQGIDVTKRLRELIPIENIWIFNSVDREDMGMGYCME